MGANDKLEATFHGEYRPKVTVLTQRLYAAKAHLAALPRPSVVASAVAALPWDTTESVRAQAIEAAQAEVQQIQKLLEVAERNTIQHLIDLLECLPQDFTNWSIIREALAYARALAQAEESQV